ncbi:7,8-dihydro-8-oxoguanine triphosphatase [Oceanobacillus oncorhynchi subsp. incaldanensis]|uniref:8-oxo-dGTP diphosphatase n=2 Tax=Oceanobacillus TaxID=182709 RepID=A0A0A1MTK2_9BACI|nr:8-oxo-dGTP diphosphatase [Oceanobacillus oncorhynchi]MDM8100718.1 8-oxo-dGTP diphosphatase [Oceanobacillus oncorhynchi]UUI41424.1 8-oxo-dGTP diphosphatase [Oceanobacillus oncorhynchi]GIO17476.1 7,8-dihydro-8-oxoguanine triphosphatase [Oceanobacillus oncorhynchi subsp. incaldanensis]CEI82857.1 8-oxo-dGTP diphosphatase [Oceanobacillus oncorhynchi]
MGRSEAAIFTNMCMIENGKGQILVQDRQNKNWPGITFPGGHIEKKESFHDAVVREVEEETGLHIKQPVLCGTKQFQTNQDERYVVLLYKTNSFSGELKSSDEGEVFWIDKAALPDYPLAPDFMEMYKVFVDERISEFYYNQRNEKKEVVLF